VLPNGKVIQRANGKQSEALRKTPGTDPVRSNGWNLMKTKEKIICVLGYYNEGHPR